jgi:hypothetical protein
MESEIKGLVKGLVEEVIKADMTMHASQVEAWAWMASHSPKGDHIPTDIIRGFPESRYLSMNEVVFKMYLKPVPVLSLLQRIRKMIGFLPATAVLRQGKPYVFEFCNARDREAQSLTITIKRLENGKVKVDYTPADTRSAELMNG